MRLEEGVIGIQPLPGYQRIKKRRRRTRPKKRRYIVIGICLFLAVSSIILSIVGYPALANRYHQDLALAHTGGQDLQAALTLVEHNPLDSSSVGTARLHFTKALASFTQLQSDLAPLPDLLASTPAYGARLGAAKRLLPLAITLAQAGLAGCASLSIIAARLHEPLNTGAQGLTTADITLLHQNLQQLKLMLNQAIGQANQLQPVDLQLDPRLSKLVGEFHTRLPLIQNAIGQAEAFLAVAPQVLGIGTPAYYLVEILDSSELRPGGGFIGNYGIATLSGGRFVSARVVDTYLLDRAFERTHRIPFPPAYSWFNLAHKWGLRDSNLDADFPTSALNGETHYAKEGGKRPLAGVIAITPALIEHMLALTGPIQVPEYHETVTAQNLMDRIHYHQLIEDAAKGGDVPSADGYSSVRKHFTALLGKYFLARLHALPGSTFPKLLQILINSVHSKDIQLYFNASAAEKLLQFYHFDDSIQSPAGDGIFVVDANISPSKANKYLITTVKDQVSIDQAGNVKHHTIIKFTWTVSGPPPNFYGSALYRAYVRVYMPVNSVLRTQVGWVPKDTGIASGRRFWGGRFSVNYPSTGTITLTWSVAGAVSKDTRGWHYLYLIQRQAGAQQQMNLQITFPSCAAIIDTSPGLVKDSKQHAYLKQALTKDTGVRVDYTC